MKIAPVLGLVFLTLAAVAAENPYDEKADARLDIQQALAQAATNHLQVIVVFGANWCADCRTLDAAMKTGASAPLLARDFKIVNVNVSDDLHNFERNKDVARSYGVPLEKGIPAVVILSPKNEVRYATRAGELNEANRMGDKAIYEFFKRVTAPPAAKP
jgi:protein disulfide-isomerase